jgi:hypothetical protein
MICGVGRFPAVSGLRWAMKIVRLRDVWELWVQDESGKLRLRWWSKNRYKVQQRFEATEGVGRRLLRRVTVEMTDLVK